MSVLMSLLLSPSVSHTKAQSADEKEKVDFSLFGFVFLSQKRSRFPQLLFIPLVFYFSSFSLARSLPPLHQGKARLCSAV